MGERARPSEAAVCAAAAENRSRVSDCTGVELVARRGERLGEIFALPLGEANRPLVDGDPDRSPAGSEFCKFAPSNKLLTWSERVESELV